jgi:hypothetical protein
MAKPKRSKKERSVKLPPDLDVVASLRRIHELVTTARKGLQGDAAHALGNALVIIEGLQDEIEEAEREGR